MSTHTLKDLEMPDDEPMVIIRSSLLWICDGDKYAAAALNMYVHWTRWLMKRKPVAQEINAMLKKKGRTPSQDTTYIIYRKQSYLIDDLLGFCSEKRLRQANTLLTDKGLLKVEDTPRSISDHVLKYELQIDAFKTAMEAWRKYREASNENDHDEMVEVSLEADLDETENLPLRDGKKSAPTSLRNGKKSDSERENDRHNRYSNSIDDTHRNIQKERSASSPEEETSLSLKNEWYLFFTELYRSKEGYSESFIIPDNKRFDEAIMSLIKAGATFEQARFVFNDIWDDPDPFWKQHRSISAVNSQFAIRVVKMPATSPDPSPDGATFLPRTVADLREMARLNSCNEQEAIAEAQKRFEQSGMSVDAFDSLVAGAIMAVATQTDASGDEWLRRLTAILDTELPDQMISA